MTRCDPTPYQETRQVIPGITSQQMEAYRTRARAILEDNRDTFDRLATSLLAHNGEMSATHIRVMATPGMPPRRGVAFTNWMPAQRHALADRIEAQARDNTIPPHVMRILVNHRDTRIPQPSRYNVDNQTIETRIATAEMDRVRPGTIPGLRYGDPIPMEVRRS